MSMIPADYAPITDLLRDRVILVTGATGALGSAASLAFARHGATVVLLGRNVAKLEALYDRIEAAGGAKPAIAPLNLMTATWKHYEEVGATLEQEFGRLDGLLHTAAHFKAFTRLEDLDPREWMDSLQINLTAAYTLTRVCLPLLRRAPDASVVQVSDAGGRVPKPFQGVYGVTKAAAETLFKTWALELENEAREASGLRFNTFNPGPMNTPLRGRGYLSETLQDLPKPDAHLPALLWLLGPDSRGHSGQAF